MDGFTWLKKHYGCYNEILSSRKDLIYIYKFGNDIVYVGLTIDLERRYKQHKKSGSVYNFCQENNLQIPEPQIIESNLTLEESKIREEYWINYYKDKGYKLLNKAKAGSVGTLNIIKFGDETDIFIEKAQQIHGDRYDYSKVEYVNSKSKVMIICPTHGEYIQKPYSHLSGSGCPECGKSSVSNKLRIWFYESCKEESKKYSSRNDFQKDSSGAYEVSRKNKWLDEFFPK